MEYWLIQYRSWGSGGKYKNAFYASEQQASDKRAWLLTQGQECTMPSQKARADFLAFQHR